ncbi:MAG: 30S ribosome-binding factor RbfA [Sedimentisphaerales bacterium]|nr:30S ribosome-binding factor RbfA [Sedimentisphaerales bacterium]
MSVKRPASRRQEKVARVIRDSISDTIAYHLSDPRITGLVSVTEVDVSPDLRNAEVFLSILASDSDAKALTFQAIQHATRWIQTRLGDQLTGRFCPHLHFREDVTLKKTLETLNLIDEVSRQLRAKDAERRGEETESDGSPS